MRFVKDDMTVFQYTKHQHMRESMCLKGNEYIKLPSIHVNMLWLESNLLSTKQYYVL